MTPYLASVIDTTFDFFMKGGPFMALLLILSVTALTVIILRGTALKEKSVLPPPLKNEVLTLAAGDSLESLNEMIRRYPSPLGRVLNVLIEHLSWSRAETIEAIQTRARHEISRLEKGLVFLEITTGVAPLLGLLGTLSGLVGIFAAVGGSGDPVIIARGISEALNTTIVGLGVAAPSLTAYNYFQRKIEVMAIEMESITSDLLVKCYRHQDPSRTQSR